MLETSELLPARAERASVRASAWAIRGNLDRNTYLAIALFGFTLMVLGWWWLAGSGLVDKVFLPTPGEVLKRFHIWLTEDNLLRDVSLPDTFCRPNNRS